MEKTKKPGLLRLFFISKEDEPTTDSGSIKPEMFNEDKEIIDELNNTMENVENMAKETFKDKKQKREEEKKRLKANVQTPEISNEQVKEQEDREHEGK